MSTARFRGGVHPDDRKAATASLPVVRAGVPASVTVPMSQHLGAPCEPVVAAGDRVKRGQTVGDIRAKVSAPVHSPVDGTVTEVADVLLAGGTHAVAVRIEPDAGQDLDTWLPVAENDDPREVVCAAGIVGMGGAAFPTKVKLEPPHDMPVSTVLLNGCECEPYLTCDHRTMLESPGKVVGGAKRIRDIVGAKRIVIGVEDNKPDAIDALRAAAGEGVEVMSLPTRYPQGAEKQLIWAVLAKEVPHGKLPAATGALVHNVGTAAAVHDAFELRKPLIERVVTVSGAVAKPGNYLTLIGTSVGDLLEMAGGVTDPTAKIVSGGPMCGAAVGSLDVPVTKGTSGVIAIPAAEGAPDVNDDQACIRCGRCADACPMMLEPYQIGIYSYAHDWDRCEEFHALDCIECGCCAFVCPSRRPLVPLIRRAKATLMSRGAKL
ncbi:MAG: electron transport complex subunit RsxC [Actinobacteria bacterium]|nr:MAG: electron transport complex subunit RsxC [Actinomycetota bacterium]